MVFMRCGDTLLRNFFGCAEIKIMPDRKSFEIYSDDRKKKLTPTNLFDALYLIRYLENNLYLGIDQIPKEADELDFIDPKYKKKGDGYSYNEYPGLFMGKEIQEVSIPTPPKYIFNSQLAKDLQRFCSSTYHPISALIDLASDFNSLEQRINEEHLKVARRGVKVAIIIGLCSIILYVITSVISCKQSSIENKPNCHVHKTGLCP